MKKLLGLSVLFSLLIFNVSCAESSNAGPQVIPKLDDNTRGDLTNHFVNLGAPARATELALEYFQKNQDNFDNQRYVSVLDMSLHSSQDRFFLLDMLNKTMTSFVVAHGRGSDPDHDGYAQTFSNVPQSKMSSLGFYQVSETYTGSQGYSVKMDGLSTTNSKARSRAIVIHGADYVKKGWAKMGRSWGCPALDNNLSANVINKIKNGSLLFMYAPEFEAEI